jgi:hypothetical protein
MIKCLQGFCIASEFIVGKSFEDPRTCKPGIEGYCPVSGSNRFLVVITTVHRCSFLVPGLCIPRIRSLAPGVLGTDRMIGPGKIQDTSRGIAHDMQF